MIPENAPEISYDELRADVIELKVNSEYEVICYLVAIGVPIKPYILAYISRLNNEYLINRIDCDRIKDDSVFYRGDDFKPF